MKNILTILLYFLWGTTSFFSCIDEPIQSLQEGYLSVKIGGEGMPTRAYQEKNEGDEPDKAIYFFRILAFDKTTSLNIYNETYYGAALTNDLQMKVKAGTYDFLFLANEPSEFRTTLNSITQYSEIQQIAFPQTAFNPETAIPMIAGKNNVSVSSQGQSFTIGLRRLAARLDVVLKAKKGMEMGDGSDPQNEVFKGITLSRIPDKVPLVWGLPSNTLSGRWDYADPHLQYTGNAVARNVSRSFTVADNSSYFENGTPDANDLQEGLDWVKKIPRIILPANYFTEKTVRDEAVMFKVDLRLDKYNPFCELKIEEDNYTFPANAKLDLTGKIKEPLEMNIKAAPWIPDGGNWETGKERILTVSHTTANITDLNGVRITFWSNMPRVKILPEVTRIEDGAELETNLVFNDLAVTGNSNETTRFAFNPATGNGYMDILADGGRDDSNAGVILNKGHQNGTYKITLSADDGNGKYTLERTILVKITQYGIRFTNHDWKGQNQYSGVFFRNNEMGERIITGQHFQDKEWTVTVPVDYQDFIVVSSTPSFDPGVGTTQPGLAEDYPVVPNKYKGEPGNTVKGKGRIYFRIGTKGANPNALLGDGTRKPRYGFVQIKYFASGSSGPYQATHTIYVRQGEDPDYLFENGSTISSTNKIDIRYQPLVNQPREAAVRFSPYNLTAEEFLEGNDQLKFKPLPYQGGKFVEYPSQGGAFFQWGLKLSATESFNQKIEPFYRRAFNPGVSVKGADAWISTKGYNRELMQADGTATWEIMWEAPVAPGVTPHGNVFETCPNGYRRPTDGLTTALSTNGPTPSMDSTPDLSEEIKDSEFRVSLFTYPFSGDANPNSDLSTIWDKTAAGTYPTGNYGRVAIDNTYCSFYADGYFDRRPINTIDNTIGGSGYAVATNTPRVAYVGILFVNPKSKASLFFPATGRLSNDWADFASRGKTGYYWSSSAAPRRTGVEYINANGTQDLRIHNGAWSMEAKYDYLLFRNTYADFGQAIRCVKMDTN